MKGPIVFQSGKTQCRQFFDSLEFFAYMKNLQEIETLQHMMGKNGVQIYHDMLSL